MAQFPKVFLVGAGPGDPELLTIKAQRLLGEADVVVYDRLVSDAVLSLIPAGASRIYAGKASSNHSLPQDEINELLLRLAKTGRRVVRLKGGDPFVFGRGSEEATYLFAHGVDCEVVPGITAAAGCTAELGIPLTHRGIATGVRFVTGHCRADVPLDLNWRSLADRETTLVFYMGLANAPEICARLIEAGLSSATPAIAISNGTTPGRSTCRGTLADLPALVAEAALAAPALLVIGDVVRLASNVTIEETEGAETSPASCAEAAGA